SHEAFEFFRRARFRLFTLRQHRLFYLSQIENPGCLLAELGDYRLRGRCGREESPPVLVLVIDESSLCNGRNLREDRAALGSRNAEGEQLAVLDERQRRNQWRQEVINTASDAVEQRFRRPFVG